MTKYGEKEEEEEGYGVKEESNSRKDDATCNSFYDRSKRAGGYVRNRGLSG